MDMSSDQCEVGDVHIALLRGINVGGKNRLPMKELVEIFTDSECKEVRTYIQSGNVVFKADAALARRIPNLITEAISGRFEFEVPVITRTIAELEAVVRNNPFLEEGGDTKTLHVAFLLDRPGDSKIATLDPDRSSPDEFLVDGREIYLRYPNGAGRSKLTNHYFESKLETTSTTRNWRTVLTLANLARGG